MVRISSSKLIFLPIILMGIIVYFSSSRTSNSISRTTTKKSYTPNNLKCYHDEDEALPNIVNAHPAKGKSIFFHETSCFSSLYGKIFITSRQACAVESAAKLNPNFEVYLLYVSPGLIKDEGTESDRFLQAILSYKNVKMYHLDYGSYLKNTLVESLYTGGKIEKSKYAFSHASDVLRYLTMWKYGGIYLDLDVVVIKSLEDLPWNYAGAESKQIVGSAILSFENEGIGHNLSTECLQDLQHNFNGTIWSNNGPGVIKRLTKRICGTKEVSEMMKKKCVGNFRVYPPETFYPIPWKEWKKYFANDSISEVANATKNSYIVHTWNKLSSETKLPVDYDTPYIHFAKNFVQKCMLNLMLFSKTISGHPRSSEDSLVGGLVRRNCQWSHTFHETVKRTPLALAWQRPTICCLRATENSDERVLRRTRPPTNETSDERNDPIISEYTHLKLLIRFIHHLVSRYEKYNISLMIPKNKCGPNNME